MKKILDLGCGNNKHKGKPNEKVIGIDKNYQEADIKLDLDQNKIPFKNNTIDKIIMNDSLEHFGNPKHILQETHRVLKKKGKLTINTVNTGVLWIRIIPIDHNKLWLHKLNTKRTGHLIHWTPNMLKMWLNIHGFKIIKDQTNSLFKYKITITAQKK